MAEEAALEQQRNRPTTVGPSSPGSPIWEVYENPLFYGHYRCRRCRHDDGAREYFKAEMERERRLRERAEKQRDSAAMEAAEERKRREAAERQVEDLMKRTGAVKAPGNDGVGMRNGAVDTGEKGKKVEGAGEAEQRRRWEKKAKEAVENPHIRRGIVGFVEFPRMMGHRKGGGRRERRGGGDAVAVPNLECQKAQFRVLLKSSNKVSPVVGIRT